MPLRPRATRLLIALAKGMNQVVTVQFRQPSITMERLLSLVDFNRIILISFGSGCVCVRLAPLRLGPSCSKAD